MNKSPSGMEPASALRKPVRRDLGWLVCLVLSALFLACCVASARMDQSAPAAAQSRTAASHDFVQLIPEKAGRPCAVSIAHGTENFTLVQQDGVFRFENEETPLDAHAAQELLSSGESILARRRLHGERAAYGITGQSLAARFSYEDHPDVTLRLGDPVPTGEGWYAAVDGDDTIYVVNNALARTLRLERRSLYALPDMSERFTAQTLKRVTIEQPGRETITIARVTEENPFNTMVELSGPIHYPANSERAAEVYLALEKLQPTALATLPEDEVLASVTLEDQAVTRLVFGRSEEGCTMRIDGDNAVYLLASDALSFLDRITVPWLAEQLPGLVMLRQVAAITVQAAGRTMHVEVDQSTKTYLLDGKAVREEDFLPVYQQMIGMLIERYVPEPEDRGEARLTIEYCFKDNSRWTLTLAAYDERYDLIVRDGCARFLISRSKTDTLIQNLFALQEEEP